MFKNLGCKTAVCKKTQGGAAWENCPRPATEAGLVSLEKQVGTKLESLGEKIATKLESFEKNLNNMATKMDTLNAMVGSTATKQELAIVQSKVENTATKEELGIVKEEVVKILTLLKGKQPLNIVHDKTQFVSSQGCRFPERRTVQNNQR